MKRIKNKEQYENAVYIAVEYFNDGKYEKSLDNFLELSEYNYDNLKVHEMLAYNYIKINELAKAKKEFKLFLKMAGSKHKIKKMKSFNEVIKDLRDEKIVKKDYNKVVKKKKNITINDTQAVFEMGFIYLAKKRYKEAEKVFSQFKDRIALSN